MRPKLITRLLLNLTKPLAETNFPTLHKAFKMLISLSTAKKLKSIQRLSLVFIIVCKLYKIFSIFYRTFLVNTISFIYFLLLNRISADFFFASKIMKSSKSIENRQKQKNEQENFFTSLFDVFSIYTTSSSLNLIQLMDNYSNKIY